MHSAPPAGPACLEQCPALIRDTLDVIAAKWVAPLVLVLHHAHGPVRYAELQRRLGAITPKELARHLRRLEAGGLVARTVHPTVPPQVDYALTGLGRSLYPALQGLADWAAQHGETVSGHLARHRDAS